MKKLLTIIIASISFLNAQTHIVPEGFSGFTVSFKHDQNVDLLKYIARYDAVQVYYEITYISKPIHV